MKREDKPEKRWPITFYLLVPLCSLLLTLAGVELILVLFFPIPYSIEWGMWYEKDPYTGYRFKPDSFGYLQNKISAHANSRGHRDDEVELKKKDGIFRILVLGDSYTMGANVRQEEAYPQLLEEYYKTNSRDKVEIINTAVGGWEPFQYAQYYLHEGKLFDPDLILIGFFVGNDAFNQLDDVRKSITIVMGRRVKPEDAGGLQIKLKVWLYKNLNLVRLILNRGPVQKDFTRKDCQDFTPWFTKYQRSKLDNHLKWNQSREKCAKNSVNQIARITELAQRKKTPVILALFPDENQINDALQKVVLRKDERGKYDFNMPQKMLVELFKNKGIALIVDLLPHFRRDPRCLYMNDTHWTPQGHRLVAEKIAEAIQPFIDISGRSKVIAK